ncbi:MAG: aminopeptidase P family protein [Candidatus Puniceispirillales bacterium]|nr:aminopeptidase P family protein [Pseudomonadota bacterium]
MKRPQFYRFHNGTKDALPFSQNEYGRRLTAIRARMAAREIDAIILTSMHNVAYYTGFLYCAFGRPYAAVITHDACTTVSAAIDAGQPWRRSIDDNVTYTDWQRGNYFRAINDLLPAAKHIGIEDDHVTLQTRQAFASFMPDVRWTDIAADTMTERMIKSEEEITLIKAGAAVADIGGYAIHAAIKENVREIDVAMAGRDAMEAAIAERFPDSELRDTWVWFQSGINTDGAHNPVTCRQLGAGDLLSLNTFPMISGYYTALERTMFLGEPDADTRKAWQANLDVHEYGLSLIKPGATCSGITAELNKRFEDLGYLDRRTFGYGHSFGVLSHYYGREAGLELREDIDTVLQPGMVVSMEPMITIGDDEPGRGGYREHDILVVTEHGAENITKYPYGMEQNIISI